MRCSRCFGTADTDQLAELPQVVASSMIECRVAWPYAGPARTAAAQHHDAMGEAQNLVEVRADQDDRHAGSREFAIRR